MKHARLLGELVERGIRLWAEGDEICFQAPQGALSAELRRQLTEHKAALVARLGQRRKLAIPSFAQQRLWLDDQLEPASAAYNLHSAWWLHGPLDAAVPEAASREIVRRHETLRTVFQAIDGRPVQVISLWPPPSSGPGGSCDPGVGTPGAATEGRPYTRARRSGGGLPAGAGGPVLATVDLTRLAPAEREPTACRLAAAAAERPFDLTIGPLVRTLLLRLASDHHLLLVTLHHIIADGWSQGVFLRELSAVEAAVVRDEPVRLPALTVQYADFAWRQRAWLRGEVLAEQLAFWRRQLAGPPPPTELPADRPRPTLRSWRGALHRLALPAPLAASLGRLSRAHGSSLYMILLAAFMTLLHRYSGQTDVVVGSPIANRNRQEIEALVGLFVNTLVMRGDLTADPTFRELLAQVRRTALRAYAHQDLPFEKLVEELAPERDPGRHPLFQVTFALQKAVASQLQLIGLTAAPAELAVGTVRFDLELHLWQEPGSLSGYLVYSTDLFAASTIARLAHHFTNLLAAVAADPDRRLAELPLLAPVEVHQQLREWNDARVPYPHDRAIPQLFEARAERAPEAIAVALAGADDERMLSYDELNRRANRLAYHLRRRGVEPETLVGVCLERSPELVVCLLAILKAGGAYVPLDPSHPDHRLGEVLADAVAPLVIGPPGLAARLPEAAFELVDPRVSETCGVDDTNPRPRTDAGNLAYLMYTSGSTGRPKGVAVTHRAVIRLVVNPNYVALGPEDGMAQLSNPAFDAATFEIWGALLHGARVVVVPREVAL
ncbi:MAG: AMP-binding protein, partial [bacterium]|nr:AMP-binding protein [bacterium]